MKKFLVGMVLAALGTTGSAVAQQKALDNALVDKPSIPIGTAIQCVWNGSAYTVGAQFCTYKSVGIQCVFESGVARWSAFPDGRCDAVVGAPK
ncbi:MAG: hypothetical protein ACT4O6_20545 [Reyranella sp.]